jgi:hypothetical protein
MSSLRTLRTIDHRKLKYILSKNPNNLPFKQAVRTFSIVPIISRILKLRYLIFGSLVGGGIAASKVVFKTLHETAFTFFKSNRNMKTLRKIYLIFHGYKNMFQKILIMVL